MCVSSLDLKLAMETQALMCCGKLFHSLTVLGKKQWRLESIEDWGIWRLFLLLSCHFFDWDELIEGDLDGTGSSFDEGNEFGTGPTV